MSQSNKKSIVSHLIQLMAHIIKWKSQPNKRSHSWETTIDRTRRDIENIKRKQPSLTDDFLKSLWDSIFKKATNTAENEMHEPSKVKQLTWNDVFFSKYTLLIVVIVAVAYFMRG